MKSTTCLGRRLKSKKRINMDRDWLKSKRLKQTIEVRQTVNCLIAKKSAGIMFALIWVITSSYLSLPIFSSILIGAMFLLLCLFHFFSSSLVLIFARMAMVFYQLVNVVGFSVIDVFSFDYHHLSDQLYAS